MYAVCDGRFQPFHIGHLAFVERIHVETRLLVVIHSTLSKAGAGYQAVVDEHHRPEKKLLTVWERLTLIGGQAVR